MLFHQNPLIKNLFVTAIILYLALPLALPVPLWEKLARTEVLGTSVTEFMLLYYLVLFPVFCAYRVQTNYKNPQLKILLEKYELTEVARRFSQGLQIIAWAGLSSMVLATTAALSGITTPGVWMGIYTLLLAGGLSLGSVTLLLNYEKIKKITPKDNEILNGPNLFLKKL